MKKPSVSKLHLPTLLLTVGVGLLLVAAVLYIQQINANRRANAAAKQAIALANHGQPSSAPATVKPSAAAINNYTVPATHPRYLLIPKLDVKARVKAVSITKNNAIGTPSNVYDTAWYTGSNLPGQSGASLIDGHVSSWTTHGVFYSLKSLRAGDVVSVQLGNGTQLNYTVVSTHTYSNNNVNVSSLLTPITKGRPGLNLITCTGDVIKGTNEFNQRVVVYAALTT